MALLFLSYSYSYSIQDFSIVNFFKHWSNRSKQAYHRSTHRSTPVHPPFHCLNSIPSPTCPFELWLVYSVARDRRDARSPFSFSPNSKAASLLPPNSHCSFPNKLSGGKVSASHAASAAEERIAVVASTLNPETAIARSSKEPANASRASISMVLDACPNGLLTSQERSSASLTLIREKSFVPAVAPNDKSRALAASIKKEDGSGRSYKGQEIRPRFEKRNRPSYPATKTASRDQDGRKRCNCNKCETYYHEQAVLQSSSGQVGRGRACVLVAFDSGPRSRRNVHTSHRQSGAGLRSEPADCSF